MSWPWESSCLSRHFIIVSWYDMTNYLRINYDSSRMSSSSFTIAIPLVQKFGEEMDSSTTQSPWK